MTTLTYVPGTPSYTGAAGTDTLVFNTTDADLSAATLTSVEVLKAALSTDTVFKLNQADLAVNGSVLGHTSGFDTITAVDTVLDLSKTKLTSIEVLRAGNAAATNFIVDQADLAVNGAVIGKGGDDILTANSTSLDLTSTLLSSIEFLKAGQTKATAFTLDAADLAGLHTIAGNSGNDTLTVKSATIDVSTITLSSIEFLKAGLAQATTFELNIPDGILGITGSAKLDTVIVDATLGDFSATTLTSIETLSVGSNQSTLLIVDQADLAKNGSVVGGAGTGDELMAAGTSLDLTSTTVTGFEKLGVALGKDTTLTLRQDQIADFQTIYGSSGSDTLLIKGTDINLSAVTLYGMDAVKAGSAAATTFTFAPLQLGSFPDVTTVIGGSGIDTLTVKNGDIDLSATALTGVEKIVADPALAAGGVTITVDQADLAKGGSVIGTGNAHDKLVAASSTLDLTSTTVSSIEDLEAGFGGAVLTVTSKQLAGFTTITGGIGAETLVVKGSAVDLGSETLSNLESIKAGLGTATTFTLLGNQLVTGGGQVANVIGGAGIDSLTVKGTFAYLDGALSLTSIEKLVADPMAGATGTAFSLKQQNLASGGSIIGNVAATDDVIATYATSLDLSSTTLTSIEQLTTNTGSDTTFTLKSSQLPGLDIGGNLGVDTVAVRGSSIDLTSTTLFSIEKLTALGSTANTFHVDLNDIQFGVAVSGNKGIDTLIVKGTDVDLKFVQLNSIERLVADSANGTDVTTFRVDQADLASGGSVIGLKNIGGDILEANDVTLDLTSTTLSGIDILRAGTTNSTTFTVDQADLPKLAISGTGQADYLFVKGTTVDLTSSTLSSVEILSSTATQSATFTLSHSNLSSVLWVAGTTNTADTLIVKDTNFDLSNTLISQIEVLKAGVAGGTTFLIDNVDAAALGGAGKIIGSAGKDVIQAAGNALDLSGVTLSSVETLRSWSDATLFTLDEIGGIKSIEGSTSANLDDIRFTGSLMDLTGTTLSNIEYVFNGGTDTTIFKIDQADLSAKFSGGKVTDTLMIHGTSMDLSQTTITFIGELTTDSAAGTTFRVTQGNLDSLVGAALVAGSSKAVDTLEISGNSLDLTSTTLSSIEKIAAHSMTATTFRLDSADLTALGSAGSIIGSSATGDTLTVHGSAMNLSGITLSGIEKLVMEDASSLLTLDQADVKALGVGGSISGAGFESLVVTGTSLDLTSVTLTGFTAIATTSGKATTFALDQAEIGAIGLLIGSTAAGDTLVGQATTIDTTGMILSGIEVLKAGVIADNSFVVDTGDIAGLSSIIGATGNDFLTVETATSSVDLSTISLSSIESITASTATGAAKVTIGAGEGGATLDLTVNGKSDTVAFTAAYKVATISNDATIKAHMLSVDHFAAGDVIDLSAVDHGTPAHSTDITGSLGSPATLKAALNIAAAGNGATTAEVVTFQYGGDTYILVDNSASKTLTADDAVIKLVGTHTLNDATNFVF